MVVFLAYGGLGNQLFQYATSRRLSITRNTEVAVDLRWYGKASPNSTARKFELFKLRTKLRELGPVDRICGRLMTARQGSLRFLHRWTLCREQSFTFNGNFGDVQQDVYLDGYWQSEKYFADIRPELLKELVPIQIMSQDDKIVADKIRNTNSVAVHVRRGDYVSLGIAAETHGTCDAAYYADAFAHVSRCARNPSLFIFSDDIQWAKNHLHFDAPTTYVGHNDNENGHQDLRLMALCRHKIIANSSFSWWGAWLGDDPEKIVVAPKRWFLKNVDTSDLIPEQWTRI